MSIADAHAAFADFAQLVPRRCETSDASMFRDGMDPGCINVVLMARGSFGVSDNLFEAIRVLAGHKLPRRE